MSRAAEIRLAMMLLTRLPVGQLAEPVPTMAAARWAFPLVGLPVGMIGWAAFTLAPQGVAGFVAVAAMALATGALHHDGLADFADGMGGGRDRAHVLDIMRDSRIGSYGVLALILSVALMAGAMSGGALAFVGVAMGSRLAMLALLTALPAARDDGLGHMAQAKGWPALTIGAAGCAAVAVMVPELALAYLAMAVTTGLIARLAVRRIGGQTGDVLGATQLSAETAGWVILAL